METCIQDQVKEKVLDNSLDCCCKPEYDSEKGGFVFTEDVDVFVIGAGISGLYLGYQALQIPTNKKIVIVEKATRVGGRLTSAPIPDTNPPAYYAEGCAQRFFLESDPKVVQLLNNLGIGYVAQPNSNIQTPATYSDILNTVVANFSPTAVNTPEYSFPDAVLLSLSGGNYLTYNDVDAFCDTLGYPAFKYPINLNLFYNSVFKLTGSTQQLVIGGYKAVCETIYNQINSQIPVLLNYQVKNIYYDGYFYYIDNRWRTRKVVYTGTRNQLASINVVKDSVIQTKQLLMEKYFSYVGLRLYIHFSNPWWSNSDLFYRWNSRGPINQLWYYSDETVLIYNNMDTADLIYDLIPFAMKQTNNPNTNITFYTISSYGGISGTLASRLKAYIKQVLALSSPPVIPSDVQLDSMTSIAFRYNLDAAQFFKPMLASEYAAFFPSINQNDNFFLISGDYTTNPGWVQSCLECVDNYLPNILA